METPDPHVAGWILESLGSGILAIDRHGAVMALNAGTQRILGGPAGDPASALGRDFREVLAAQPAVASLLTDALGRGSRLSRAECQLSAGPSQPAITIGFTLFPVRDPGGDVRGAAMIFRDLTPVERADEQARLRERLVALGEMAAGLAHEIRNPLAAMRVLAGLLRRRCEDRPDDQALVDQVVGELGGLEKTVEDCLEFVRPIPLVPLRVDPVELVESSLALARSRVAYDGAIERDYGDSLSELVVDEDRLRAGLANLIVNAFEAMEEVEHPRLILGLRSVTVEPGGRSVRVDLGGAPTGSPSDTARELVISVRDTGPGVSPRFRDKVFDPFFTTKLRGSGVGLANAQKIVGSHGGAIDLESEAGGCTFRIHLPLEEPLAELEARA